MASNGAVSQGVAPVVAAYEQTMRQTGDQAQKTQALHYLEAFQKSAEAWNILFEMLSNDSLAGPVQMFAATSLKGKMIHDVHQLPRDTLPALRSSLFDLLLKYQNGPKPIRTQLTISLAHLAIQMLEWKDVLPVVISQFSGKGDGATACFLEFLKVLAEELTEGRKISLSEDELFERTNELLQNNAEQVFQILSSYASTTSPTSLKDPNYISCIQSWTREIPLNEIIASPIMNAIIGALNSSDSFDSAVECLLSIIRETRDVDDTLETIKKLSPIVMSIRPMLSQAAEEEDIEVFKGLARLFAETGENWVVLIAREPAAFKPLIETILEVSAKDWEKEAIGYTFRFWEDLKLWLVMDRFIEAKQLFSPIYSQLVDNMIQLLEYPESPTGSTDLFDGDREQEERFKNFRHDMGNVLKDCSDVLGPEACLTKAYQRMQKWVATYGSQVTDTNVVRWQSLEAIIFALRGMGQVIPPDENVMLPQLIPLLVQLPNNEKLRYQAVLTLGRYTEWTAKHPETLQAQLNFIMESFSYPSKSVIRGATHSFQYFCTDCAELLKDFFNQLRGFYVETLDRLGDNEQQDLTEGMAAILAKQPLEKLHQNMKLCCDPIVQRIVQKAQVATDDAAKLEIADSIQLLTIFIQKVHPYVRADQVHPAVQYCEEIIPVLAALIERFVDCVPILERVCRCWRHMVLAYRDSSAPLLALLPQKLGEGFKGTRQGCFLWAADAIVGEFSEHSENADPSILQAIVPFYEQLANTFLTAFTEVQGEQLPDLLEDFFRLSMDVITGHPSTIFKSGILDPVLLAAIHSLDLLKTEVLMATLHYLRDFIAYGTPDRPFSTLQEDGPRPTNPVEIQHNVKSLLLKHGKDLIQRALVGMMYSFPEECIPDASGVVLDMFRVLPQQTTTWFGQTLGQLPPGAVRAQERERLLSSIQQRLNSNEQVRIRTILQDFTNSYRRRNVAPREGLGALEPSKFVYTGT